MPAFFSLVKPRGFLAQFGGQGGGLSISICELCKCFVAQSSAKKKVEKMCCRRLVLQTFFSRTFAVEPRFKLKQIARATLRNNDDAALGAAPRADLRG